MIKTREIRPRMQYSRCPKRGKTEKGRSFDRDQNEGDSAEESRHTLEGRVGSTSRFKD